MELVPESGVMGLNRMYRMARIRTETDKSCVSRRGNYVQAKECCRSGEDGNVSGNGKSKTQRPQREETLVTGDVQDNAKRDRKLEPRAESRVIIKSGVCYVEDEALVDSQTQCKDE